MEEKRLWGLNIGGEIYRVKCLIREKEYLLFVNKELKYVFDRDPEDPLGQEVFEEIEIGRLVCNFIVQDGRVMLVIDGKVMLNMRETREKKLEPVVKSIRMQQTLSVGSALFAIWQLSKGKTVQDIMLFLVFAVCMLVLSFTQKYKMKKEIKEAEALEEEEY